MQELRVIFEHQYFTIQVDRDYSVLIKDYEDNLPVLPRDRQYALDTAVRMLIGILKENG